MDTNEDTVKPAVIMTFEFDDLVSAGVGPGQPEGDLHNFGTGTAKPHTLGARNQSRHQASKAHLSLMLTGVQLALGQASLDGFNHGFRGMTQGYWTHSKCVVNIGNTIHAIQP